MTDPVKNLQQSDLLVGLNLLDLGTGMSAALVANLLLDCGVETTRIEPATGDPFYQLMPAYRLWQQGKKIVTLRDDAEIPDALVRDADLCIVGGDDHPENPRRFSAAGLAARNSRLIVLEIEGQPECLDHCTLHPAAELLSQARTGLGNEVFGNGPVAIPFPAATYGASLYGSIGLWAALFERERSGVGQIVRTSFVEGAMAWTSHIWLEVERPTPATNMAVPRNARHTIFQCADGRYIHLSLGVPRATNIVADLLGINSTGEGLDERGMPAHAREDNYFGDLDAMQEGVSRWQSHTLVEALVQAGIPVEYVLEPGQCWEEEQVKANGIIKHASDGTASVGHPIRGI